MSRSSTWKRVRVHTYLQNVPPLSHMPPMGNAKPITTHREAYGWTVTRISVSI